MVRPLHFKVLQLLHVIVVECFRWKIWRIEDKPGMHENSDKSVQLVLERSQIRFPAGSLVNFFSLLQQRMTAGSRTEHLLSKCSVLCRVVHFFNHCVYICHVSSKAMSKKKPSKKKYHVSCGHLDST